MYNSINSRCRCWWHAHFWFYIIATILVQGCLHFQCRLLLVFCFRFLQSLTSVIVQATLCVSTRTDHSHAPAETVTSESDTLAQVSIFCNVSVVVTTAGDSRWSAPSLQFLKHPTYPPLLPSLSFFHLALVLLAPIAVHALRSLRCLLLHSISIQYGVLGLLNSIACNWHDL